MACDNYRILASLALDEALAPPAHAFFLQHLDVCPACKAYYHDLHMHRALCAALDEAALPTDFTQSWQRRLSEHRRFRPMRIWGSAAAAALVIGLSVLMLQQGTRMNASPEAPAQMARAVEDAAPAESKADAPQAQLFGGLEQEQQQESASLDEGMAGDATAGGVPRVALDEAQPQAAAPLEPSAAERNSTLTLSSPDADGGPWLRNFLSEQGIRFTESDGVFDATLSQAQFDALTDAWAQYGGTWQGRRNENASTQIVIINKQ